MAESSPRCRRWLCFSHLGRDVTRQQHAQRSPLQLLLRYQSATRWTAMRSGHRHVPTHAAITGAPGFDFTPRSGQNYWSAVCILPKSLQSDLFLYSQGAFHRSLRVHIISTSLSLRSYHFTCRTVFLFFLLLQVRLSPVLFVVVASRDSCMKII